MVSFVFDALFSLYIYRLVSSVEKASRVLDFLEVDQHLLRPSGIFPEATCNSVLEMVL
jgi:hypothetical protein